MIKMLFDYIEERLRQAGIVAQNYASSEVRIVNLITFINTIFIS